MAARLRPGRVAGMLLGLAGLALAGAWIVSRLANPLDALPAAPVPPGSVPLAVLGDSNSHSYQDELAFGPGTGLRGGPFHAQTLQWTEVLARLRGDQLDPGPWETTGREPGSWGDLRHLLGAPEVRSPRKSDYRYNLAYSGAPCRNLMGGRASQAPRLLALMDRDPARWRQGVIVVRIGMADLADPGQLDRWSRDPDDATGRAAIDHCLAEFSRTVAAIRARHAGTHIVLVGIFDDSNDPNLHGRWQSAAQIASIGRALDRFDDGLRALAARGDGLSFFDDRAWFRGLWGGRDADGRPAYRSASLGRLRVSNTVGDAPTHAVLADDHAGLAWNALWAQALTRHLAQGAVPLRPIGDAELAAFVQGLLLQTGGAPAGGPAVPAVPGPPGAPGAPGGAAEPPPPALRATGS